MGTLDVHFGGLCAFVPNRTPSRGPATSWSVLLLNLEDEFGEGQLDTLIAPHFSVLRYRLDHFDLTRDGEPETPDLVLDRLGKDRNPRGVVQLRGRRIEMELPGGGDFAPLDLPLTDPENGPRNGEARSIRWLPKLDDLLSGAGTLAPQSVLDLFDRRGFPRRSRLNAHVLLRSGSLETSAFGPQGRQGVFNVWEFVTRETTPRIKDTRTTAYRLTLCVKDLAGPSEIRVFDRSNEVVLRQKVEEASCSIMNYELEEVLGWARGNNVEKGTLDSDFDLAYWLAQRHRDGLRGLPRFKKPLGAAGLGTRRRTCALAQFSSFDEEDASLLDQWPEPSQAETGGAEIEHRAAAPAALRTGETRLPPAGPPPTKKGPVIGHLEQEENEWCWVACQAMSTALSPFEQCELADRALGRRCCRDAIRATCCQTITAGQVRTLWNDRLAEEGGKGQVNRILGPLHFQDLRKELDADPPRPVQIWLGTFSRDPDDGVGHLVMVAGYYLTGPGGSREHLIVHDPASDFGGDHMSFEMLRDDPLWAGSWIAIE